MRTLVRAIGEAEAGGRTLHVPLLAFTRLDVGIRASELSMIAGVPGAGKSSLALYVAVFSRVPTLYVCADTSAWTMVLRMVAMLTGMSQSEVESRIITEGDDWAKEVMSTRASHIHWVFDSAPTLDDIDSELQAYNEVMGADPELVVIDNLVDVSDGDDEFASMRRTMKELKFVARDTSAAVLVLHHTSEAYKYDLCPPRASLQGKVAQLPALVLTVHSQDGSMLLASVKNRYGQADPSGQTVEPVWFTPNTMQITDVEK